MKRAFLAIALLLVAAQAAAQDTWRVYPPSPTAGEPFVLQYDGSVGGGGSLRSSSLRLNGSTLFWDVTIQTFDFAVAGSYRASAVAPGVPAGDYQIVIRRRINTEDRPALTLGTISIAAAAGPSTPAFRALDGNWFDPNQPGWGMNIVQGDSGALFGVWLTYSPMTTSVDTHVKDGMWLVMPEGRWLTPTRFRGLLYSTSATTVSRPFNPRDVVVTPAGYASIDFSSAGQAVLKAEAGVGLLPPVATDAAIRRFEF